MKIIELYLKNFGKFHEKHIYIRDGVQVIYGENEFGKSTIHAFIRAMLFGLERGRGRAAGKDAFSRYEPWENPGYYAGVMRFVCGGRTFRLERRFGRTERSASLICEDDGEELSVEHGDLDMLLGGITPSLFDSTVSIGQLMSPPGRELADALKNYAANYYETGGGEVDLNGALQTLRERRKDTERSLREAESLQEEKRQGLIRECTYLESDMAALRQEYEEKRAQMEAAEKSAEQAGTVTGERGGGAQQDYAGESVEDTEEEDREEQAEFSAGGFLKGGAAGMLVGVIGLFWAGFVNGRSSFTGITPITFFAALILAVGIVLTAAGVRALIRERKEEKEYRREGEQSTRGKADARPEQTGTAEAPAAVQQDADAEIRRLRWEMDRIRSEWKEKQVRRDNLKEQADEIGPGDAERSLEARQKALILAEEKMKEAAASLGRQTSGRLNARTSEIFSELTEGRYRGITAGDNLEVTVWDGERRIRAEQLSRGTLEQIYFSIRMAAAEVLLEESVPVLLDDTFAFYDEKRLESVLKWLSRQKRQVIIFTCHRREEEILEAVRDR